MSTKTKFKKIISHVTIVLAPLWSQKTVKFTSTALEQTKKPMKNGCLNDSLPVPVPTWSTPLLPNV